MEQREILSLLGLALRGGNLAVGEEPAEAVCRAKDARLLLLADDAADNTRRRAEHFAQAGACLLVTLPVSKAELGRALGRTSAAIAAVTDAGLAAAVGRRLAAWDPERYGPAAERLELKAQRARQRREEQEAHRKNLRTGRKRKERAAPAEAADPVPAKSGPKVVPPKRAVPAKPGPKAAGPAGGRGDRPKSRTGGAGQSRPPQDRTYRRSRPVKKGKGSFRKRES